MKSIDEFITSFEENAKQEEDSINGWLEDGWQEFFLNLTPEKEKELWEERKQRAEESREQAKNLRNLAKWLKQAKEYTTGWIPVGEKLPMADGEYLLFGKMCEDEEDNIFIGNYDACAESFGWWEGYYDKGTLGFLDSELRRYAEVKAWMPLPEPYNESKEKLEQGLEYADGNTLMSAT